MPHLPRNSWRSSQLPSSFLLCKLDLCSQHLLAHYILYTTPYKIAGEWHSVTQGDTPVLLTCFPYHNILWLFCCHLRPSRWMVRVSLLQQVGDREKVRQDCSQQKWCNLETFLSGPCTVLCVPGFCSLSNPSTPWNSQWGFLKLKRKT